MDFALTHHQPHDTHEDESMDNQPCHIRATRGAGNSKTKRLGKLIHRRKQKWRRDK